MDSIAKGLTFIIVLYPEDATRKETQAWVQTHSETDSSTRSRWMLFGKRLHSLKVWQFHGLNCKWAHVHNCVVQAHLLPSLELRFFPNTSEFRTSEAVRRSTGEERKEVGQGQRREERRVSSSSAVPFLELRFFPNTSEFRTSEAVRRSKFGRSMDPFAKGLAFIIVLGPEDATRKQTQAWVQTHSERDSNGGR